MARMLLAVCALFGATLVQGQTSRGTVTGVVTDATKASVPAATVEITNKDTNVSRSTQTNDQGIYRFDAVDPGTYDVVVKAGGFKTHTSRAVPVTAAQTVGVDAALEVGEAASTVEVTADAIALQTEAPVRGGTINTVQATQLPLFSRNPNLLAITLPGVTQSRSNLPGISSFSANGGRTRSNNFLLDGTENNDISVAGQAFQVKNPEAVQEVSVQTGLYDAEFGRAGGAVVNTITKSGTNELHGSLGWVADFTNDDAITNTQSLSSDIQSRGKLLPGYQQYYNGTIGGPIIKNKTFFFGSWQEERQRASNTTSFTVPSLAGRERLRSLFPQGQNANVDLYLDVTQSVPATGQFTDIDLGLGRGNVQFGTGILAFPYKVDGRQFMGKVDHQFSERDLLSVRYGFDRTINPTAGVNFPGFFTSQVQNYHNVVLTETHIFSPVLTNELRIPFNRITFEFPNDASDPRAQMPEYSFTGVTNIGVSGNYPQGRIANNYAIQDTMSYVHGKHTFRFGLDLLQQRSRQTAPSSIRGLVSYGSSNVPGNPAFVSFANFVDDYAGAASISRDFGSATYYPELFRQAYFFQDRWQLRDNVTVTLGLRWEDFGTPANSLPTPAFAGLFNVPVTNPASAPALQPNKTVRDLNNFAPVIGMTYSPRFDNGVLGTLFGNGRTVLRAGFNMGYDSFFNNIASNAATSVPNMITTATQSIPDATNPRGLANASRLIPQAAATPLPNGRQDLVIQNLRNPYYSRWSAGLQRQLPWGLVFDGSYVGSSGVRLFQYEDLNPQIIDPARRVLPQGYSSIAQLQTAMPGYALQPNLDPLQGIRYIRTNGGHSSYHSAQFQLQKRFSRDLGFSIAYTASKMLDNASEIFTYNNSTPLSAVPSIFGGQHLEKAPSLFDRPYRLVLSYNYQLPMFRQQEGLVGRVLGGWRLAGITTFESGVPLNVSNGADADGVGGSGVDRPDFNPAGQAGVRARPSATSSTGYVNPDVLGANGQPVEIDPAKARYIGLPTCTVARLQAGQCRPGTSGRNTERTPGIRNFDVNVFKNVRVNERFNLEFRTEFFNFFNTPQYGVPSPSVFHPGGGTPASNVTTSLAGRFLQYQYLDGGARLVRYNLTLRF